MSSDWQGCLAGHQTTNCKYLELSSISAVDIIVFIPIFTPDDCVTTMNIGASPWCSSWRPDQRVHVESGSVPVCLELSCTSPVDKISYNAIWKYCTEPPSTVCHINSSVNVITWKNIYTPIQTSLEISFLGSPKDSIFYSIARFFYKTAILCCHQNPVANSLQGAK